MKEDILRYINEELIAEEQGIEVAPEDELLVSGYLDSLGLVRLLAYVEDSYGLRVPPRDVTIENFGTVELIVGYLGSLGTPGESA